jgi:hypothetical protein
MVSSKGGRYGFVYPNRFKAYRAFRRQGKTKTQAAKLANAGPSFKKRSKMARKAARTRKRRGR